MSLTTFTQSTLWTGSDLGVDVSANYVTANVSGLGNSQCVNVINNGIAAVVGEVFSITFQVSQPPPQIYLATASVADTLYVQTPAGTQVETEPSNLSVLPNAQFFQPSAGGTYIVFVKVGIPYAIGAFFLQIQTVIQNTLGQYLNMNTISFGRSNDELKASGTQQPQISTSIALNTTSAVPNTLIIDFVNYPLQRGLNTLASIRVLVSTSGIQSFGSDFLSTIGAASETVTMIAGTWHPINYYSPKKYLFTGRVSLTIQTVGTTIIPATTLNYAIASMFPNLIANQPTLLTQAEETANEVGDVPNDVVEMLRSFNPQALSRVVESRIDTVEDAVVELARSNDASHKKLLGMIERLTLLVEYPVRDQKRPSIVIEAPEANDMCDSPLVRALKSRSG